MNRLNFKYSDGGRAEAGIKGNGKDCVVRAFAIATGKPYGEISALVKSYCKEEKPSKRRRKKSSARTGVHTVTTRKVAAALGFEWTPTMGIGTGCRVHLRQGEIPDGRIIAKVTRHLCAIIDGTINDTHDPSRDGTRCVYGYYHLPQSISGDEDESGPSRTQQTPPDEPPDSTHRQLWTRQYGYYHLPQSDSTHNVTQLKLDFGGV